MKKLFGSEITAEDLQVMNKLLAASANQGDIFAASDAFKKILAAVVGPIREGVLDGDIFGGIYSVQPFAPGTEVKYPLDFVTPGTEGEYAAYTIPKTGYIPEKNVEGDYVIVPTYKVGLALDWSIDYARDCRWDIMARVAQVLEAMLVRKCNFDGWRNIVAAATDRNVIALDSNAPAGYFTKRLVSLMQLAMRRYAGGNSTSLNPTTLTDIYISPENMEDIRSWDLTQVDDVTRREIYVNKTGKFSEMFGVRIHELFELGENQMLQTYFAALGGSFTGGDKELVVGLCKTDAANNAFVMPLVDSLELYDDPALLRQQRQGTFGWQRHGFAVLDNRATILGTC